MVRGGEVILRSALQRRESRGSHYRTDFPKRDDRNWMVHVTVRSDDAGLRLDTEKVAPQDTPSLD